MSAHILYQKVNQLIETSKFPSEMKSIDVTLIFKKEDQKKKDNYRPISILTNLLKLFERCIYNQLSLYFNNILSKSQCRLERVI